MVLQPPVAHNTHNTHGGRGRLASFFVIVFQQEWGPFHVAALLSKRVVSVCGGVWKTREGLVGRAVAISVLACESIWAVLLRLVAVAFQLANKTHTHSHTHSHTRLGCRGRAATQACRRSTAQVAISRRSTFILCFSISLLSLISSSSLSLSLMPYPSLLLLALSLYVCLSVSVSLF